MINLGYAALGQVYRSPGPPQLALGRVSLPSRIAAAVLDTQPGRRSGGGEHFCRVRLGLDLEVRFSRLPVLPARSVLRVP